MPVLRPYIMPTLGQPQPVVAPPRRRQRTMMDQDFYEPEQRQPAPVEQPYQTTQQTVVNRQRDYNQEFEPTSNTGNYLQEQLANYANRAAPPELQPGGRVRSPNAELVQPQNFKMFYDQLESITQIGNERVGQEVARSAFKRLEEMRSLQAAQVPYFEGMPVGYKNPKFQEYIGGEAAGEIGSGLRLSGRIGSGVLGQLGRGGSPQANFRIAQQLAKQFGWGPAEVQAWYTLGMKESGWNNHAQNPTSTAYGIGQFLDSTWAGYGIPKTSDPRKQVLAMARYIKARYGSPSRALSFHYSHNWY